MEIVLSRYPCPCCGHYTLEGRGDYEICPVCFWEDDNASEEFGKAAPERPLGPNFMHLWEARENYLNNGTAEERMHAKNKITLRPPSKGE